MTDRVKDMWNGILNDEKPTVVESAFEVKYSNEEDAEYMEAWTAENNKLNTTEEDSDEAQEAVQLVHYSEDEDFEPAKIESVDGYVGCWFYECPDNIYDVQERSKEWGNRKPHFFEIDSQYVETVQEVAGIMEYFIEAENLDKLRHIDPELSYEL